MAGKLKRPDVFRQSLLAAFETCARRTRFAIQNGDDLVTGWTETSAELGAAAHAVFAEMLRTMYRYGHEQMPTQEAVEVMYEVLRGSEWVLPLEDLDTLRGLVLGFCEFEFNPKRILCVEQRLTLPIMCEDGVVRVLKGQPDVIVSDPPSGLVIEDWKTGKGRPKKPREVKDGDDALVTGKQYLSERGHFQLDVYGLLVLKGFLDDGSQLAPGAKYVTLRERHMRSRVTREASLSVDELEHVERQVALQLMLLDRAISEGPKSGLFSPRPGSHCTRQCPVARSCPIPREQRGDGAIATPAQADAAARQMVVAKAVATQTSSQLKAWEEGGNRPGRANEREEVRWDPPGAWAAKGGGRKHGLHPRVETEEAA